MLARRMRSFPGLKGQAGRMTRPDRVTNFFAPGLRSALGVARDRDWLALFHIASAAGMDNVCCKQRRSENHRDVEHEGDFVAHRVVLFLAV